MKPTRFFLLAAFLLSANLLMAQIGVKAGINIASLSQDRYYEDIEDVDDQSVIGFQAGLVFDLGISRFFTIQPEILFIQKGGKFSAGLDEDNEIDSRLYLNYVEVPVLAKFKFNTDPDTDEGIGFYLIGGPFASYALNGRTEGDITIGGIEFDGDEDIEFDDTDADNYQRRVDWGFAFGGGLRFGALFLDARYNLGINNLLDRDVENDEDDPYLRTRGIGLTLGYMF